MQDQCTNSVARRIATTTKDTAWCNKIVEQEGTGEKDMCKEEVKMLKEMEEFESLENNDV